MIGPATEATPLTDESRPNMSDDKWGFVLETSLEIAIHVETIPLKAPKSAAKAKVLASVSAKPQLRNAAMAEANERKMVMAEEGTKSDSQPTPTWPATELALYRARTTIVEVALEEAKPVV